MTTNTNELHVIFGTGPLGLATMHALVAAGKRVRMVNRSGRANVPAGVAVVKGDATSAASTREVSKGATVVYQIAQPAYNKWVTEFPAYQAAVIEGAAAAGAKLVVAENLYMYGHSAKPLTEDMPYSATTRKGTVRAKMAEDLMAAHKAGKVQATSGRGSNFYGPEAGQQGAFGDRVFPALFAGKTVSVIGDPDMPHTYTYITDFGKGLAVLGTHDAALGQAWHIPNAPTRTTRELLTMFFAEAGVPPKIGQTPAFAIRALGLVNPIIAELPEMMYEFTAPFVVDADKFIRAFGDIATPQADAVRETVAWFRAHPPVKAQKAA